MPLPGALPRRPIRRGGQRGRDDRARRAVSDMTEPGARSLMPLIRHVIGRMWHPRLTSGKRRLRPSCYGAGNRSLIRPRARAHITSQGWSAAAPDRKINRLRPGGSSPLRHASLLRPRSMAARTMFPPTEPTFRLGNCAAPPKDCGAADFLHALTDESQHLRVDSWPRQ